VIGIILLIFICVGLIVYVARESCEQDLEMQEADVAELTVLRMSSLRTRTP
jgi:glucose uptake protein GlcU